MSRRGAAGKISPVASPVGLSVVFLNVLAEQLGLPVPAVPTLVVAGALASAGRLNAGAVSSLALAACLIGDGVWYLAGRRFGGRVMNLLCRISLTPDSCVNQTQTGFERWGANVLIVSKFIPGLALIAPPLAGATRMGAARFLGYSLLGSALWVGAALLGGVLLRPQIEPCCRARRGWAGRRSPSSSWCWRRTSPTKGGSATASTRRSTWRASASRNCTST